MVLLRCVAEGALAQLTEIDDAADIQTMNEKVTRIKAEVFSGNRSLFLPSPLHALPGSRSRSRSRSRSSCQSGAAAQAAAATAATAAARAAARAGAADSGALLYCAGFIAEVIDGAKVSDPETAAALEKLQTAHQTLFRIRRGAVETPRTSRLLVSTARHMFSLGWALPMPDAVLQWNGSECGRSDEPEPEPEPEPVGGGAGCAASGRAVARAFCSQFVPASAVWLPAYRWREQLKPDIVAGVTLTIMGLPQGKPHECPRPGLRCSDA